MKSLKINYLFWCLFFLSCSSTGQPPPATGKNQWPSTWELRQAIRQKKAITLVYANGSQAEEYRKICTQIAEATPYFKVSISSDKDLSEQAINNDILFLIGSPQTNTLVQMVAAQLPMQMTAQTLSFASKQFSDPSTMLRISGYPSPLNRALPLFLITGFDDRAIIQQMQKIYASDWGSLIWSSQGYKVYTQEQCRMMGFFSQADWQIDLTNCWDFSGGIDTIHRSPHFEFIGHRLEMDPTQVVAMGKRCEGTLSEIEDFCGREIGTFKITYHLYNSAEEKGLLLSNTQQSHIDFENTAIHTVVNEAYRDHFGQKENELMLRHLLGLPSQAFLQEGLGLYFTRQWQGKGYDYWAQKLFRSNNRMPLSDLLHAKLYESESPLVKSCMAASFVEFLIAKWGKNTFLKNYNSWVPRPEEIEILDREWSDYLSQKPALNISDSIATALPYWKGFNFAHEGYQIYNGYISKGAQKSLVHLRELGSNAIAVVPYSYMEHPNQASFFPITQSAGSENDESVIHVIHAARELGMQTLLKPQVWLGHGSWSGFVKMDSQEEWTQFFDYYYRWIRHYAMLAEIHGAEALSVGVEFGSATLGHEAEWIEIFQKLRGIYSGQLTYCANWGEEFEQLSFWKELDFIGLNCYYPLSKSDAPKERDLQNRFAEILKMAEGVSKKYQKPIVFTEIGFRPVDGTWKDPHDDAKGRAYNENSQGLCYEVVFQGLQNQDWCKGILWWKWPSYLEYGNHSADGDHTGFTPYNKAAEKVVEKWFLKD